MGKLVSIIGNCFPGHKLPHSIHPWFCKGIDHEICFLKGMTEETEENREALMDKSWNFQNLELGLVIQFTMEARSDSTKRFFIKIIP